MEVKASVGRPPPSTLAVTVQDPSQIGEARRAAAAACRRLGFDESETGRASIMVSEAAGNALRHGRGGEILLQPLVRGGAVGLEVIALDRGPGIGDIDAALADGHSTSGSSGTGLGAMRRLASFFEAYSLPGRGTAVVMQLWPADPPGATVEYGAVAVAKPGETACGDVWDVELTDGSARIVVADGLGHGLHAREAALAVVTAALASDPGVTAALTDAHLAARSTRGAALAVADVDLGAGMLRYGGFGNVAGVLLQPDGTRRLVSMNGTMGQGTLRARAFAYAFAAGALLVLSSDGLGSRWDLDSYPGLSFRHPSLVAAVLYRDFSRRRDDVTVLAARLGGRRTFFSTPTGRTP
jgi:anti-sigma regulatory factor (Ser/Thr protein kinase)